MFSSAVFNHFPVEDFFLKPTETDQEPKPGIKNSKSTNSPNFSSYLGKDLLPIQLQYAFPGQPAWRWRGGGGGGVDRRQWKKVKVGTTCRQRKDSQCEGFQLHPNSARPLWHWGAMTHRTRNWFVAADCFMSPDDHQAAEMQLTDNGGGADLQKNRQLCPS